MFTSVIGKDYPWTFAWGNHDCEVFWRPGWFRVPDPQKDFKSFEEFLSWTKNCLYVPSQDFIEAWNHLNLEEREREAHARLPLKVKGKNGEYFDGYYGGNFKLELVSAQRDAKAWDIFIFNSRQDYHIPLQALHWMEEEVKANPVPVPALCFYHLPSQGFQKAWDAGSAQGVKGEGIQYGKENGWVHEAFKRAGTVRACFAGHDHKNDFMGSWEGILYVYGRKTLRFSKGAVDGKGTVSSSPRDKIPLEWGAKLITLELLQANPMDNEMTISTILG